MAALWNAQDIAASAYLQVAHGKLESSSQFGVVKEGAEPLFGLFGKSVKAWYQKIGIRLFTASADPAAQLMYFSQAQPVGPVDDNGIGACDVQTRFDYRGTDQDVYFLTDKTDHDLFELLRRHLAVGHSYPGLGC